MLSLLRSILLITYQAVITRDAIPQLPQVDRRVAPDGGTALTADRRGVDVGDEGRVVFTVLALGAGWGDK